MSSTSITYLVVGAAAVLGLIAFVALILRPAWQSYGRWWERLAASFLTLYALATFVGLGVLIGAAIFFYSDQL
jgi:hypothetical protein